MTRRTFAVDISGHSFQAAANSIERKNRLVMKLRIHQAGPEDAEMVALLGRLTFAETFGYLFTDHAADLRVYLDQTFGVSKIRDSLVKAGNAYWIGLTDGLSVSYAKLKFPSPSRLLDGPDVGQLQKIYVLREFLGHGIGKPMLDAVLEGARNLQVGRIWLDVLKENQRAIRFYEREGFTYLGEDHYTIGAQTFAFHLMMRDLAGVG